jgi:phosphate-selective porin OprO and OprP
MSLLWVARVRRVDPSGMAVYEVLIQGGGIMTRHNFITGICILSAAFVLNGTAMQGQEPGVVPPGGATQPPVQAVGYAPAPPAATFDDSNAELARRVSDLEKRLAEYSKKSSAVPDAPTKPLVAPSGRIQFDMADFSQNDASQSQFGNTQNAVGFRRARIALLGGYQTMDYIIEMDFANRGIDATINKAQSTAFKDVYIQMHDLPLLNNVRVGHFKECFGLEDLTSDNYTTFMERSIDDEGAFVPGRNNGIMTFNWSENLRATWAAGLFTNQTGFDQPPTFQFDQGGLDIATRATFLPWYDENSNGRGLFHVGVDYAFRAAPNHTAVFAARNESAFGPNVVNMTLSTSKTTALTDVNNTQEVDGETALVYGPLSVQSEVFGATVNHQTGATNSFVGGYVFVSYFLTGENRPYNRKLGVFDRVQPYEEFFRVRTEDGNVAMGWGAWELAYRVSYIDMLDGLSNVGAGRATDNTFGINWYLNAYTRIMANFIHSEDTYIATAGHPTTGGIINTYMMRCTMDF